MRRFFNRKRNYLLHHSQKPTQATSHFMLSFLFGSQHLVLYLVVGALHLVTYCRIWKPERTKASGNKINILKRTAATLIKDDNPTKRHVLEKVTLYY